MWISAAVCIGGLTFRVIQLIVLTRSAERKYFETAINGSNKKAAGKISKSFFKLFSDKIDRTILRTQPSLAVLSFIFHFCLIITPIFLLAHCVIFFESWGIFLFSMPDVLSDALTAVLIACGIIFLFRRIFVSEVRAVTGVRDYILLFVTVAPFVTGFLAAHRIFEYRTMLMAHIISGQLLLVAAGVTKLNHLVFFVFSRFLIDGEYGFNAGRRVWLE